MCLSGLILLPIRFPMSASKIRAQIQSQILTSNCQGAFVPHFLLRVEVPKDSMMQETPRKLKTATGLIEEFNLTFKPILVRYSLVP